MEHKLNPSNRAISAEIEIAKVKRGPNHIVTKAVQKWKGAAIVRDGSLPQSGFEINTAPASGDKYVEQIKEICDALDKQEAAVDKSCGLHIHVDARNFTFFDVRKLVFLYDKIEDTLFGMTSPDRRHSRYCIPCSKKYIKDLDSTTSLRDNRSKVLENIYGREITNLAQVRANKYDGSRYNALNLHSMYYRGTVECRLFHGTKDARDIINWGLLWAGILDFASGSTESEVTALNMKGIQILLECAPTQECRDWVDAQYTKTTGKWR